MTSSDSPVNGHAIKGEIDELAADKPAYHDQLAFLLGVIAAVVLVSAVPIEILLWKWAL